LHSDRLYRAAYNILWKFEISAVLNLAFGPPPAGETPRWAS